MKLNSISGVSYAVKDLQKSVGFYEGLGFRVGKREASHVLCYVNWFWVNLTIENKAGANNGAGTALYIKVDNIDEFYQGALANGLTPSEPTVRASGNRELTLSDPDGYQLVLLKKIGAYMQVNQTYSIEAPVDKVWQALADATVIGHWTTGPVEMDARVGGRFSLYEGDVHGTNTRVEPSNLLQQDWYGDDHPDQKYDVTFALEPTSDNTTTVRITHAASEDDMQSMTDGWRDYHINPMKQLLEQQATTKITLKLIEKQHVAGNAFLFRFEPSQPLTWTAGQYIWVELRHANPDAEGTRRWFTISSAPYEGIVQITTRVTNSTFKQALDALPTSGELELLEKPDGDFVWQDSELPMLFVAGGMGITAFHSMLKQRVHDKLPLKVKLIFGNRDEHIPFKKELDEWAANDPQFSVQYLTGMPMTAEALKELEPNLNQSLVYISGPEPMVEALGDMLLQNGLPQAQLRLDALKNYNKSNY